VCPSIGYNSCTQHKSLKTREDRVEGFLLIGLLVLCIPFVMPIVAWVSARRTRARIDTLEAALEAHRDAVDRLSGRVDQLRRELRERPIAAERPVEAERPVAAAPPPAPHVAPPPVVTPPKPVAAPPPVPEKASAPKAPIAPVAPAPSAPRAPAPSAPSALAPSAPSASAPESAFDWERVVGVKLFSAVAGIALVLAAIFFLRYSIEHGWLQPPVRVLIGIAVSVALLVVCELKAARQYPVTANALDAAAIAILFSTFFAAHALWRLIPALVAFALLALVTAVAVLLSIRRASLFIAVLGLLGGFATPALLSTGDNRPISLFAYLMLLNIGLAWVAYRQTWPLLTGLTLILTTIYQWGWVYKFLGESSLPLAMGIFVVFPIASIAGLVLAKRRAGDDTSGTGKAFERTAVIAAALPLLFAVYLAAVPAYGARAPLLLGFLLLVDAGLLAIAIGWRQALLHAAGAVATLLVTACWLALSYVSDARAVAVGFNAAFVLFFLAAPAVAKRFDRELDGAAEDALFAAALLLFVFPVLAGIEPAFASPLRLFAVLLALVVTIAWRAMAERRGWLYFIAAFFAIAAQAVWSAQHLTGERLAAAVLLYSAFGLVSIGVPLIARRFYEALEPAWGAGAVLLASLGLLWFLSVGGIAPEALWALALLLAILNAGLFVEGASGRLPVVSLAGSLLSWAVLATWWLQAAAAVGVLASLTVLTGLTLVTLAGHAWAHAHTAPREAPAESAGATFAQGLYLGLIGHVFLFFLVLNREWAIPPWPAFGTLAVLTLATSVAALFTRAPALHGSGTIAAAVIVCAWTAAAPAPGWQLVGLVGAGAASAYALAWIALTRRTGTDRLAAAVAAAVLFVAEGTGIFAAGPGGPAPLAALAVAHVLNLSVLLALTAVYRWRYLAIAAVLPAWAAVAQWQANHAHPIDWAPSLMFVGALYVVFIAYPIILGRRARADRDPYVAAIAAGAMFFFAARTAFRAGGLDGVVGVIPVVQAAIMALLLRELLRIEPPGRRDLARLALVAGTALAFITVAIPLQLQHQWITLGWALEGAALAWLYLRIPHRGLLAAAGALFATVFIRLGLNPEVLRYEPRGALRIFNWYLYTYLICAVAMLVAAWWLSKTRDRIVEGAPRASHLLPAGAVILLFLLLNIEIADYYATGPTIAFRFGATVSQDLTYTIGWLAFGMALLAAGIYVRSRPARVAAVALIAVTTFKCFLYDLGSLEGLYRVVSFVGLAISLALVSLALQKYVLVKPRGAA
jgi:uncharacterized membrane protein